MRILHIFNPSHDEALAAHSAYYYPARAARILEADLAILPSWWADDGDLVLLPQGVPMPLAGFAHRNLHYVRLAEAVAWRNEVDAILPWGWDALLTHQLRKAGIAEKLLPCEEQLNIIRQLSSRATSVAVLQKIRKDLPDTVGEAFWCTTEEEVWSIAGRFPALMLKAPWSSSGRGVFMATADAPENIRQRVSKILKLQGAIEAEPLYHRISDFALEFYATRESLLYKGISVFATTETGAYNGNVVAEEEKLRETLPPLIQPLLPEVIKCLCSHLSEMLISKYEGPLGVDMMIVRREDGTLGLHPCVEINLRNTMGHVALHLRPYVSKEQTGVYCIRPVSDTEEKRILLTPHAAKMEAVLKF